MEELAEESREQEKKRFVEKCATFQREIFRTTEVKFRELAESSDNFRDVDVEFVRENPLTVRILRYLTEPILSRDKFSEYCDVGDQTLGKYEDYEDDTTPRTETAEKIIDTFEEYRNESLLPWLEIGGLGYHEYDENALIKKLQTAIAYNIATSEANTEYRNWRATKQHDAIAGELVEAGFEKVEVDGVEDLEPGEYETELNVSNEEADFAIRNYSGVLTLIEAKMSGTEINFRKRRKEMVNDYNDWTEDRSDARIVAVIGGVINTNDVETLQETGIRVFWDHQLDGLSEFVSS
ncbi:XamI family restriction endonuclease [Halorubrum sp. JWXQ-INN 858]|uniref:XamI family restriction endonuclease n=1 Tax=Halorubrum sp. JWXQ-INN 858 TaxID=2690782 RepID=UPI00135BA480|nr:XamI family restriction endonuclease [Halorubrum sp. JWXQ-INN 858]MWV65663.1 XamI family restriction endonuclease [Halorubrum sp. JWXQ-INN 858]